MVGPERFELSTFAPPVRRANQAALRPDWGGDANGTGAIDNLFRARLFHLEHDGGEIIGLMVLRLVGAAGVVQAADELSGALRLVVA